VQRLRHGDQVAAAVGQAAGLGRRLPVIDARMGCRLRQLFGRQVGGMDVAEMGGQGERGLAVAGGAVPGPVAPGDCAASQAKRPGG
jgi:hypothetical protein